MNGLLYPGVTGEDTKEDVSRRGSQFSPFRQKSGNRPMGLLRFFDEGDVAAFRQYFHLTIANPCL